MIFSSLYANNRSIVFPSAIEEALEYLKSHDFTTMEPGVYEIKGKISMHKSLILKRSLLKNSARKYMKIHRRSILSFRERKTGVYAGYRKL